MKVTNIDNRSFELWVLSYQFPDIHHDEYDSNWLRIGIRLGGFEKAWVTSDPSLLTWELNALRDWLQCLGTPNEYEEVNFIEPNLGFQLVKHDSKSFIRINLALESRPDWFTADDVFSIEIRTEPAQIIESIRRLDSDLERFSPRAGVHF